MRSPLEFGQGILHYSQFSSSRLKLPNPFFQFCMGLLEEEVKPLYHKEKLEVEGKVKELDARNNE